MVFNFLKEEKNQSHNLEKLFFCYEPHGYVSSTYGDKSGISFKHLRDYKFETILPSYKSIFNNESNLLKFSFYDSSLISNYLKINKSIDKHNIKNFADLISKQEFVELKSFKLVKYKYSLLRKKNWYSFSPTAYGIRSLKKLTIKEFNEMPEYITNPDILPDPKVFEKYMKSLNIRDTKLTQYLWNEQTIKDYKKNAIINNDQRYNNHIKIYEDTKKQFYLNKSLDFIKYKNLLDKFKNKNNDGIINYLKFILFHSPYPKNIKPTILESEYNADDKVLIININLPDFDRVPMSKWNKNETDLLKVSKTEKNSVSEFCTYMITIRTLYEIFLYDTSKSISSIGLNGIVKSVNKATGHFETNTILSLFVKREQVEILNLELIDPKECFRSLKGVSASKIQDKIPIQPILTFKKDPRIVDSKNILDNLEEENLAVMEWDEFEHLIRELFAKEFSQEGSEVKVTQASRDKGVDAIAYDPDPIRGGKFIIQAKRYTATVDVSAVRDLYGTIMNEGANRGILVTTAKFGSDAYDFAKDKNITLLEGNQLLGLLNKHGYSFKIDITEARKILNLTPKKTY